MDHHDGQGMNQAVKTPSTHIKLMFRQWKIHVLINLTLPVFFVFINVSLVVISLSLGAVETVLHVTSSETLPPLSAFLKFFLINNIFPSKYKTQLIIT